MPAPIPTATTRTNRAFPFPVSLRETRPAGPLRRPEPPRRETLTGSELLAILNGALAGKPGCDGVRLGAGRWELEADAVACNWSETSLIVRVHGTTSPQVFAILRQVIAEARDRYDVRLED